MAKEIYKYNDGFSDVWGDPSEIDYRMARASEDLDMEVIDKWLDTPKDADGNPDESKMTYGDKKNFIEACHRLLPVIRSGFEIKEFDKSTGQGLTMEGLLEVYANYVSWKVSVKKNTGQPLTGATPTGSPATSSGTSMGPSTRSPGSQPQNVSTGSPLTPDGASPSRVPSSTGPTSIFTPSASASTTRSRTP